MKFSRYLRTLWHLRAGQCYGQVLVRLRARLVDPATAGTRRRGTWELGGEAEAPGLPDPVPLQDPAALARGTFSFIDRTSALGASPDWNAPGQPRLWRYNLHYFDWLWSLLPDGVPEWAAARRLTLDWIERHPPARGACGWEPYPTSLRLMNWALLFGLRHRALTAGDSEFRAVLLESIGRQTGWLERNLETHIQANHLLENLAALACVASVFEGSDRDALLARTLPRLRRELAEQILADGMHYERSPMYHLRVLWLMEVLTQVGRPELACLAMEPARRMRAALVHLRHPDGAIAQFNDAAPGIYADRWPGGEVAGAWSLPSAGYYGYRGGTGNYLIVDAGPIGPDHQPGHAHADLLSFELSLGGRRVITDTGIGSYEPGPGRLADRSTAAHNTVEIEGRDSVEVWGSFRVGRRVVPTVLVWEPGADGLTLTAEHRGFDHLACRAVHRRAFEWRADSLVIRDEVAVIKAARMCSRIHLAPGVKVRVEDRVVHGELEGRSFRVEVMGSGELAIERSLAHPTFGGGVERPVIVLRQLVTPPGAGWQVQVRWS